MDKLNFRKRDGMIVKDMGEETVLYDQEANQVHSLNATAALIYNLCDGYRGLGDIVGEMLSRFNIDEKTARRDVERILSELKEKGILR
ncbi:MAG: PqqD family protein [Nitrospinae bacterium]|nr:PqqD family protein [Nitrospinota bacterium]